MKILCALFFETKIVKFPDGMFMYFEKNKTESRKIKDDTTNSKMKILMNKAANVTRKAGLIRKIKNLTYYYYSFHSMTKYLTEASERRVFIQTTFDSVLQHGSGSMSAQVWSDWWHCVHSKEQKEINVGTCSVGFLHSTQFRTPTFSRVNLNSTVSFCRSLFLETLPELNQRYIFLAVLYPPKLIWRLIIIWEYPVGT